MRRLLANCMLAGLGLAVPLWAFGQAAIPVIPPVQAPHAKAGADAENAAVPVWKRNGTTLSVTAAGRDHAAVPDGSGTALEGHARSAAAGVSLTTRPGITAHAGVREIRWAPLLPACADGMPQACSGTAFDGVQRGEVGAGFAGRDVRLDLSVGHAHSEAGPSAALQQRGALPRVLPGAGGADVAAPLWFRNSTSTSISARGSLDVAPDTSVNLGASVGRVRLLPGVGLPGDNSFDQTTLSLGVQHGPVRGAIVGHVLEPDLPGAALDRSQRWSGIDLGISVRLPWRGQLNFGAQNVWSSGRAPLSLGPDRATPEQGRVPYVQYHQDL